MVWAEKTWSFETTAGSFSEGGTKMFNSTSPVAKSRTLLAVFTLSVLSGACGLSTTEADTQVLTEGEETQFPPMANSLALSSPFPRFILLPLNNPGVVPVELAEHMRSEDIIAGVVVDGKARAYPLWIFGNYHVANDTIGDAPVMLAYCEMCSGAAAFRPVVEGFDGRKLGLLSVLSGACGLSTTEADTQVLTEGEETQFPPMANSLALSSPFPRFILLPLNNPGVVPVELAEHMRSEDIIAGVVVDGKARAYPLWIFGNYHVANDTIGDAPVMLAYCEMCSGAAAFRPVVEGFDLSSHQ